MPQDGQGEHTPYPLDFTRNRRVLCELKVRAKSADELRYTHDVESRKIRSLAPLARPLDGDSPNDVRNDIAIFCCSLEKATAGRQLEIRQGMFDATACYENGLCELYCESRGFLFEDLTTRSTRVSGDA
jgi:hypothetical protein